jgi:hypothetical protein
VECRRAIPRSSNARYRKPGGRRRMPAVPI